MTTPLHVDPLPERPGFRLSGELDASNARKVARRLDELGQTSFTLDLTTLEFIDSAGLNVVIGAARGLPEGTRLTLRVPASGPVRRVIDLMGLDEALERVTVEAHDDAEGAAP